MSIEEKVVYCVVGIVLYFTAYLAVARGIIFLWKIWATHKVGAFWEYGVKKGMEQYHPELWDFIVWHRWTYNVVYVGFWPITVPVQLVMTTKVLNRIASKRYYY